jgi:hypothetical protein
MLVQVLDLAFDSILCQEAKRHERYRPCTLLA